MMSRVCTHIQTSMSSIWKYTDTRYTLEVQGAERQGYKIKKIYEVHHLDKTTKHDPKSGKGGLFAEYINMFLKIKQEASGWPNWCSDEDKRSEYIKSYMEKERIQ